MLQGRSEIEWVLKRYPDNMRDRLPSALIDNILWAVAKGVSPNIANCLNTQYELSKSWHGSHEYFDDGVERNRVIHIDPNFKIPDSWRIFPRDRRHPGRISLRDIQARSEQDGWNGKTIQNMVDFAFDNKKG